MTRKLIMLRHGQTEYNASGRMQGQMDTKLSDVGIRQAEAVARYMKGVNIGYVVSSDLSRAAETARIVASSRGLPVHLDPRLRETNLGDWQGQSREDVDRDYPGARAQWRHNALWAPPGGESRIEVARRARDVINELMLAHPGWDDGVADIRSSRIEHRAASHVHRPEKHQLGAVDRTPPVFGGTQRQRGGRPAGGSAAAVYTGHPGGCPVVP